MNYSMAQALDNCYFEQTSGDIESAFQNWGMWESAKRSGGTKGYCRKKVLAQFETTSYQVNNKARVTQDLDNCWTTPGIGGSGGSAVTVSRQTSNSTAVVKSKETTTGWETGVEVGGKPTVDLFFVKFSVDVKTHANVSGGTSTRTETSNVKMVSESVTLTANPGEKKGAYAVARFLQTNVALEQTYFDSTGKEFNRVSTAQLFSPLVNSDGTAATTITVGNIPCVGTVSGMEFWNSGSSRVATVNYTGQLSAVDGNARFELTTTGSGSKRAQCSVDYKLWAYDLNWNTQNNGLPALTGTTTCGLSDTTAKKIVAGKPTQPNQRWLLQICPKFSGGPGLKCQSTAAVSPVYNPLT
ncbi:hypothetical protein [Actinoplanes sp. NPDC051859]|uniref:hypothetical protein n=1 Tax=Actinoplanes sp. NPDC051859 TaxID=3363909 RepID=UPI0037898E35